MLSYPLFGNDYKNGLLLDGEFNWNMHSPFDLDSPSVG